MLNALVDELENSKHYYALYCSLETVQGISDPVEGIPAIIRAIQSNLPWYPAFKAATIPPADLSDYNTGFKSYLANFCASLDRPLVVLFDEADCLSGQTMVAFLRQLRDGYVNRARAPFPASIALVGLSNIRDYKAKVRQNSETLGSASPFNVIAKSLTLGNFTREEIAALYRQHTSDTGQIFEDAAIDRSAYWTCGQPWLVNAVAHECVEDILDRDLSKPITSDLIDQAAENILQRRDTHVDSLLERLKEERVRRVVEPVLLGREATETSLLSDDSQYVLDLGILTQVRGALVPANPIYAEVILRTLSYDMQMRTLRQLEQTPWVAANGLDMNGLLKAFQQFWRENSEAFTQGVQYRESAPHIMLQAFLQRVINGGGQIVREYALGRMRMDLLVIYKSGRYPIEIKLKDQVRKMIDSRDQLLKYIDRTGTQEGWLVIFDRTTKKPWSKKISWKSEVVEGKTLHIVGC